MFDVIKAISDSFYRGFKEGYVEGYSDGNIHLKPKFVQEDIDLLHEKLGLKDKKGDK